MIATAVLLSFIFIFICFCKLPLSLHPTNQKAMRPIAFKP